MENDILKQILADRDEALYRLIDYRIAAGDWKLEDRQRHYDESIACIERFEQQFMGTYVLH